MRWLQRRLGRRGPASGGTHGRGAVEGSAADALAAYRSLLDWADHKGLGRRRSETTGQLQARLSTQSPETTDAVDVVTSTYEYERYGQIPPPPDRLKRVRQALAALLAR
jgi:hypothetical protein